MLRTYIVHVCMYIHSYANLHTLRKRRRLRWSCFERPCKLYVFVCTGSGQLLQTGKAAAIRAHGEELPISSRNTHPAGTAYAHPFLSPSVRAQLSGAVEGARGGACPKPVGAWLRMWPYCVCVYVCMHMVVYVCLCAGQGGCWLDPLGVKKCT